MPVEDHPLYEKWRAAKEIRDEAHDRLLHEVRSGPSGLVDAAKKDLKKAQAEYDDIVDQL